MCEGEVSRGVEERMRERPVPSWMPLMTERGVWAVSRRRRPVAERRRRAAPTRNPAMMAESRGAWESARAAAAIACGVSDEMTSCLCR